MAASPQLVSYIKQQMDAGFRKAQIYDVLLQAGWYKEEIDEAFYEVVNLVLGRPGPEPPQPSVREERSLQDIPEKPGFFWKLGNVLVHPGRLFEAVRKERDIGKSLSFYGLLSFIHLVILLVSFFVSEAIATGFLQASPIAFMAQLLPFITLTAILMLFFGYSLFLAMPFIAAGIVHSFIWAFRGGKGFSSTFRAVVYSLAPTLLIWPVMLVYFLAAELTPYTPYLADILLLLIAVWVLCLLVKGLKRLHGISGMKAALAVLIPLMALAAIIVLLALSMLLSYLTLYEIHSQEPLRIIDFSYSYDGGVSLVLRNFQESALTINTVNAACGQGGSEVLLGTSALTHLQPGDSINYSTLSERCVPRNPGERYSINVSIRYMDESNYVQVFTKEIEGNII